MVLGILGLVLSFVPCLGMYALPLTVLAVILGALAMRSGKDGLPKKGKGMAIAGLVCGLFGSLIGAYWLWAYMSIKNGSSSFEKEFKKGFNEGIEKAIKEEAAKAKHDMPDHVVPSEKPDPATP